MGGELGSMNNISLDEARVLRDLLHVSARITGDESFGLTDIEALDSLLEDRAVFTQVMRQSPLTARRAKRILAISSKLPAASQKIFSATLEAARTGQVQVRGLAVFLAWLTLGLGNPPKELFTTFERGQHRHGRPS